jgi:hypothetical protein
MITWLELLIRVGLFIWGINMLACGFFVSMKLAFPNKPISQKDRILRSVLTWLCTSLLAPGMLLVILTFSTENITFENIANVLFAYIVFSPLAFAAGIGTYQRLQGSTKLQGDMLFLDENKKRTDRN